MKLQYYEILEDKSKEYLLYLIEQIKPEFTENEFKIFSDRLTEDASKGKKKNSSDSYINIYKENDKNVDLSKLKEEKLKDLFQIFISREKNDKTAIEWRFYRYIKYIMEFNLKTVKFNIDPNPDLVIDFIIETEEKEIILALCSDILELDNYRNAVKIIHEFVQKENLIPDRIIFATGKSFRNIPIDTPIKIVNDEVTPELWIEWREENCPFNKEDLIILNNSELKLAGFNFTSTDDLLNYVYTNSDGGQISLYRQIDFFTETDEDEPELELFWKGIVLK